MASKTDIDRLILGETLHLPPDSLNTTIAIVASLVVILIVVSWAVYVWWFA